jgi:hypothetical protein
MTPEDKERFVKLKAEAVNQYPQQKIDYFRRILKPQIFVPRSTAFIENLNVKLVHCQTPQENEDFQTLIELQSVFDKVNKGCGAKVSVLVKTQDEQLIGMIRLTSAGRPSKPINELIKWSEEVKWRGLQHLGYAHAIIPLQPFGFNCLGGKLLAMLSTSKELTEMWNKKYRQLYGIVTLSMTGGLTQYNGLKNYKKLAQVKSSTSDEERGIYYAPLYANTINLLNETETIPIDDKRLSVSDILNDWKPKAIKRYTQLKLDNRLKTEIELYDSLYIDKPESPFFS